MTNSEARLRRFLLAVSGMVLIVTIVELLLEEHTETGLQFIPFVLCAAGIVAIAAHYVKRTKATGKVLRVVMIALAIGGALGVYLHIDNNIDFEREIHPRATTSSVVWKALRGASPLLAPGILALASLLALAATRDEHNGANDR